MQSTHTWDFSFSIRVGLEGRRIIIKSVYPWKTFTFSILHPSPSPAVFSSVIHTTCYRCNIIAISCKDADESKTCCRWLSRLFTVESKHSASEQICVRVPSSKFPMIPIPMRRELTCHIDTFLWNGRTGSAASVHIVIILSLCVEIGALPLRLR